MATVALPPFATLRSQLTTTTFSHTELLSSPSVSCGLEGGLCAVEAKEVSTEDSMELSSANSATYTELSSAFFSQIKRGHADLYGGSSSEGPTAFSSWTTKHPEHWQAKEVLDWLYSLTEAENFDGALFRGEAYNKLTGKQLCSMTLADFISLDTNYGAHVHEVFNNLLQHANFKRPSSPETFKYQTLGGNVPDFDFLECPSDVTPPRSPPSPASSPLSNGSHLSVFLDQNVNEVKVSLDGLGLYDIDLLHAQAFDQINDSDYSSSPDVDRESSNSVSSDVFEPMFTDDEDSSDIVIPDLARNTPTPSSSSDSGCESDDRRHSSRRRPPSTSKGNHLWEFVLDLLKDSAHNPSHVRWEDKELGVFKFVQSEAVAKMWGHKKNNPGMTYEKLSRAMRFCRSAGYFASVPKTGRFPKKLCFKFGPRAHSWQN